MNTPVIHCKFGKILSVSGAHPAPTEEKEPPTDAATHQHPLCHSGTPDGWKVENVPQRDALIRG